MTQRQKDTIELVIPDFVRDTRRLPPDVVGAWLRIILEAHTSDPRGVVTAELEAWARLLGVMTTEHARRLLAQVGERLHGKQPLGDVQENLDGTVTITCRRIAREETKQAKARQRVERCRGAIMPLAKEMQALPALAAKWEQWVHFRKTEMRKLFPPTTQKEQMAKCIQEAREYGEQAAVDMLQRSIDNGWSGVFGTKERAQRRGPQRMEIPPADGAFFRSKQ